MTTMQTPKRTAIVFDIETGPQDEAKLLALLPPFDPADVKVGNIKDPAKIAEKIAEAEVKHKARFLSEAALSPATGQVLAIGYQKLLEDGTDCSPTIMIPGDGIDERVLLKGFWDFFAAEWAQEHAMWVGHNVIDFDLPFLVNRSRILGIKVPFGVFSFQRNRVNWGDRFIDTRTLWLMGRKANENPSSLDHVARSLGVGEKSGSGADFAQQLKDDPAAAIAYLTHDLAITSKVARKLGII